ncbi:HypC/HybG/HupF family hydrogenase formation chaperone [Saccharomonospora iraqiensis]|uniref:HypC/HybG/HupF family hydrogenase formation chaperone n=1 Tax=Saccharomonospora iraqiensis TaxID=52698 RepID=UPI00022E67E0|nr:HypC/HybG/HupF family hydrogenase formation chaperone [Saccharomonospora iraqiensis]
MSAEQVRPPGTGADDDPAAHRAADGHRADDDRMADEHCASDGHCVTCSDAAVTVRVVRVLDRGMARVDTGAGEEEISVALVPAESVVPGAELLVHAGEAIGVPR